MKTTKKVLQIMLPLVLLLCVFASCEGNAAEPKQTTAATVATTTAPQTTAQQTTAEATTTASEVQSTSSSSSSSATAESTTAAPEPLVGYITADGAQAVELISKIHKGEDVGIPTFNHVYYQTTVAQAEDFLRPLTGEDDCALLIIVPDDYTVYTYVSFIDGRYYSMRLTSYHIENGDPSRLAQKMTEHDYFYRIEDTIGENEITDFVLTTVEGLTAEKIQSMRLDSVQFDPYIIIVGGIGLPPPPEDGFLPSIDAKYITLDPTAVTDYILGLYNNLPEVVNLPYFNMNKLWDIGILTFQFEERGSRDHAMIYGNAPHKEYSDPSTEYTYLCRIDGKYHVATLAVTDIQSLSKDALAAQVADQLAKGYGYMVEGTVENVYFEHRILYLSDDQSLTAQDALDDENKGLLPMRILIQE
ncbi:MAG: hypothetical protein IKM04_06420 [Clostridia bacterium]|nr:hypothetical protein [Clostridia bacterium]